MKKNSVEEKRNIDEVTCKIIDYFNGLCNSIYYPNEHCLSMKACANFKGDTVLKPVMPGKPIKMGMKYYILADSKTSFVCNISLYTWKSNTIN
ncbi:hypothetical protein HZS_7899 [Henneguya salminicola]|nr:hypothetical protein HZS_7899 [Henneguya salminicola]